MKRLIALLVCVLFAMTLMVAACAKKEEPVKPKVPGKTEVPEPRKGEKLPGDLKEMEYRRVAAAGEFDYGHQLVLKNQDFNGAPGINLVTPLGLDRGDGRMAKALRSIEKISAGPTASGGLPLRPAG